MNVILTQELESLLERKVASGRYTDASDVVRDALRRLEHDDDSGSPALEAALMEGLRSSHRSYDEGALDRVRAAARALP